MNNPLENSPPRSSRARSRKSWQRRAACDLMTFARSIQIPGVPFDADQGCDGIDPPGVRFGKHTSSGWIACSRSRTAGSSG